MTSIHFPAGLLLALVATIALTAPAHAFRIEDGTTTNLDNKFLLSPSSERITTVKPDGGELIGPGMTIMRQVIMQNRQQHTATIALDIAQVVGSSADLIVEVRHGVREGAAAWATLERRSVTLKPGQTAFVDLEIRIPKGIKPGSKAFAVTTTQGGSSQPSQGTGIATQFVNDAVFIVDLPGDAPIDGQLTEAYLYSTQQRKAAAEDGKREEPHNSRLYVGTDWFAGGAHDLSLVTEYRNDGERLLSVTGDVVVHNIFGQVVGRYEIKKFTAYPDGGAAGTVELRKLPSLGIFQPTITLKSEAGEQVQVLPRFIALPRWFIAVMAALLLYGLFALVRWLVQRRHAEDDEDLSVPSMQAQDGEPDYDVGDDWSL